MPRMWCYILFSRDSRWYSANITIGLFLLFSELPWSLLLWSHLHNFMIPPPASFSEQWYPLSGLVLPPWWFTPTFCSIQTAIISTTALKFGNQHQRLHPKHDLLSWRWTTQILIVLKYFPRFSSVGFVNFGKWTLYPANVWVERALLVPTRYNKT